MEKFLQLVCIVAGAVGLTLSVPELLYYAPPIHVIMFASSIIFGGAGIRALLKN